MLEQLPSSFHPGGRATSVSSSTFRGWLQVLLARRCHHPECHHQAGVPARGRRCVAAWTFPVGNEGAGSIPPFGRGAGAQLPCLIC